MWCRPVVLCLFAALHIFTNTNAQESTDSPSSLVTSSPTTSRHTTASPTSSLPTTSPATTAPTSQPPSGAPTTNPTIAPTILRNESLLTQMTQYRWALPTNWSDRDNAAKFSGAVYSDLTEKVYGIPSSVSDVLVVNPATQSISIIPTLITSVSDAWAGGVASPSTGKIYGIPSKALTMLVIDPVAESVSTIDVPVRPINARKWSGGVYHPNSGFIFGIPAFGGVLKTILAFDPATNTTADTSLSSFTAAQSCTWSEGFFDSAQNKIYAVPATGTCGILTFTPGVTLSAAVSGQGFLPVSGSTAHGWRGVVHVPERNVAFGIPGPDNSDLLMIDPQTNTASLIPLRRDLHLLSQSGSSWWGAVYHEWAENIVGIPHSGRALVADPIQLASAGVSGNGSVAGWADGVFDPNTGIIIAVPYNSIDVLVIEADIDRPTTVTTTATTSMTSTVTTIPSDSPTPSPTPDSVIYNTVSSTPAAAESIESGDNGGTIIGAAVGVLFIVIIILVVLGLVKRSSRNTEKFTPFDPTSSITNPIFQQELEAQRKHLEQQRFASPEVSAPDAYVALDTMMYVSREDASVLMKGYSSGAFVVRPSTRSTSGKAITLLFDEYGRSATAQFAVSEDHTGVYIGGQRQTERFSNLETLLTAACIMVIPPFPCALCPLPDEVVLKYASKPEDGSLIIVDEGNESDHAPLPEVVVAESAENGPSRSVWGDDTPEVEKVDKADKSLAESNRQELEMPQHNKVISNQYDINTQDKKDTVKSFTDGIGGGYLEVGEEDDEDVQKAAGPAKEDKPSTRQRADSFKGFTDSGLSL